VDPSIAVVIPCHRGKPISTLCGIGPEVASVYVVDEPVPEQR
jgi:hypothetical protein